ncbi:MAG: toll/interleukin-1 receptor domain-containing protein [Kineosporiaceae bacterium]
MPIKVFVSHHSRDADFADALVRLLRAALPLQEREIRCTAIDAYGIAPGATIDSLRDDLEQAAVVIGLLTQASIRRSWLLFELGHAWANNKAIALLAGDVRLEHIPGPLGSRHAIVASERAAMCQLIEQIRELHDPQAPLAKDFDRAMIDYLSRIDSFNEGLGDRPAWTDAGILPDRQTLFRSAIEAVQDHPGTINRVEIYAPTGVWEVDNTDKLAWFQALSMGLANDSRTKPPWLHSMRAPQEILGLRTKIRGLHAIFGLPPRGLKYFGKRMQDVGHALGLFHGLRGAYLTRAPVDTATIPGIGYIRIDEVVIAAWAVREQFGVDTGVMVTDSSVGAPVGTWFQNIEKEFRGSTIPRRKDRFVIQDLHGDRDFCVTKGMNRIYAEFGLPPGPDCEEHGGVS